MDRYKDVILKDRYIERRICKKMDRQKNRSIDKYFRLLDKEIEDKILIDILMEIQIDTSYIYYILT